MGISAEVTNVQTPQRGTFFEEPQRALTSKKIQELVQSKEFTAVFGEKLFPHDQSKPRNTVSFQIAIYENNVTLTLDDKVTIYDLKTSIQRDENEQAVMKFALQVLQAAQGEPNEVAMYTQEAWPSPTSESSSKTQTPPPTTIPKAEAAVQVDTLEEQLQQLTTHRKALVKTNHQYHKEIRALKAELEGINAHCHTLESTGYTLARRCEQLQEELEARNYINQELEAVLKKTNKEAQELQENLAESQKQLQEAETSIQLAERAALKSQEQLHAHLQTHPNTVQQKIEDLEKIIQHLENRLKTANQKLSFVNGENGKFALWFNKQEEENKALQKENEQLKLQIERLQAAFSQQRAGAHSNSSAVTAPRHPKPTSL